jgi:cell division septum initiation protein DivIVA
MDIQHLVDRLEDLVDEGRHLFGTKYTMVDEERTLEIIDQMRISIPEEIEKAARVLAQRDRILAEAHEESARIVQENRKKAEQMLEGDSSVHAAQVRAESIKEQARQEAMRITSEADAYVFQLLGKLEQQLIRNMNEVRNGITVLQQQPAMNSPQVPEDAQPVYVPQPVEEEAELVEADLAQDSQ